MFDERLGFMKTTYKTQLSLNYQMCVYLIFSIGVLATGALILAGLVALAFLLNLSITVFCEVAGHIGALYSSADSFTKLLMLCIVGYVLFRVCRHVTREVRNGK
jgi:hypothetical protein